MAGKPQCPDLDFPPQGKLAPLQADIIHTDKIPKGKGIYRPRGKAVGIALRAYMAEALDAYRRLIQQSPVPTRPKHGQCVGKLRAPDMNHIRTECIQPLSKQALQLRCLPMGPLAGENKVGKTLAQAAAG